MKRLCAFFLTMALLFGLFTAMATTTKAAAVVAEGIDVSYWQGNNINWNAVAADSHGDFAILRAYCYGKDTTFDTNYSRAKDAGVPLGAYCYIYGTTTAAVQSEVNALLSVLEGKQFEYPIYIDIEDTNTYAGLGAQTVTNLVKTACQMLENAGYFAGVYTYTSFAASYIYMSQLTDYTTWIADYRGYVGYTGAYAMWQYGCEGSVGGISPVDVNYSYTDFPTIIKSIGLNNYEPSVTYPYDVDSGTKMLYDGENKGYITTAFSTAATVYSGNKTQGSNSLKLEFTNPAAQYSGNKVGGMAVLKFANSVNLSEYNYIQYDVYLSRKMTGSNGFQTNFITDTTEDGYNYMRPLNDWEAGWHTVTVDKPAITKAVASADWSNINKIRFLWFNFAGASNETYFLIDNVRAFKENPLEPTPEPEPEPTPEPEPEPEPEPTVDPMVEEFRQIKQTLPAVSYLELSHAAGVERLKDTYDAIPEESKTQLTAEEVEYMNEALEAIARLEYLNNLGDVDEDGEVGAKDALEVLKYSVGKSVFSEKQQAAAEVDGADGIGAKDALEILKYSVGKIFKFPIEEM